MNITVGKPQFRPVTIVIETQDELDQLEKILYTLKNNVINYNPQVIRAAAKFHEQLSIATMEDPQ